MDKKVLIYIAIGIILVGFGILIYNSFDNRLKDNTIEDDIVETSDTIPDENFKPSNGNENAKINCTIDINKPINKAADEYFVPEKDSDKISEYSGIYLNISNSKRSVRVDIDFDAYSFVDRVDSKYGHYMVNGFKQDVVATFVDDNVLLFLTDGGDVYYSDLNKGDKINSNTNRVIPIGGKLDDVYGVKKFYYVGAASGSGAWDDVVGVKADGSFYDLSDKIYKVLYKEN